MMVLDYSKVHMYSFFYEQIIDKYGYKNVDLCYMDTDSLIMNIKTENIYKDMLNNNYHYDFSDYKESHPIYKIM